MTKALIVIDVQNDFCPGGALAVPGGNEIVEGINALMNAFDAVILTQDWHPSGHSSFASSHVGKVPYDLIEMPYGPQLLWPDHCIQGSLGAQFHEQLYTDRADMIVRKGHNPQIDSYSAFFENDQETPTGLEGYLRTREIDALTLVDLAASQSEGHIVGNAQIRIDLCRAIDLDGSLTAATEQMRDAGIRFARKA